MTCARTVYALVALLTLAPTAAAQDREYIRLLERLLVGASGAINADIADLRRQLARCDGAANRRLPSDNCAARPLIQAQLNYLLRMGLAFGDPDTAGTPTPVVPTAPRAPDPTDYVSRGFVLAEKVRSEPSRDIVHVISEDRATLRIIGHCTTMKEYQYIASGLTDEEMRFSVSPAGQAKTKADINACIGEYDAKAIVANRKAAIEYCLQTNRYAIGTFEIQTQMRFDLCMHTHDMLQAMCKQALEHQTNYMMRKLPGQLRSNQTCPGLRPNPREVEAILAAPAARTMAELPPKFLAVPPPPPPHPDYPVPAPPVPIPAGTVLDTTLNAQISAVGAEPALEQGIDVPARLDRPLVVGGQTVLAPPTLIFLRARIIGPGPQPNSVRVGITTGLVQKNGNEGGYELKSDELVFTVAGRTPLPAGVSVTIPPDTKLRFTIGSSASSAAPSAGASPATPAGPATSSPTPGSLDPQRQPERQAACAQQAFKDHPRGGVELTQALSACTQVK